MKVKKSMVITTLPDKDNYSARTPALNNNIVVFARTDGHYFYPEHFTSFLFLTNFVSRGAYTFNGNKTSLSEKSFLLSKPDDKLEMKFGNAKPLETFIILFDEKFFLDTYSFYQKTEKDLLESPIVDRCEFPSFPDVPFESSLLLRKMLMNLLKHADSEDRLNEELIELIGNLTRQTTLTANQISKISAVKKSTRHELYRRLHIAKEFMEDNLPCDLSIERIAKEACLNKFHFITMFKSLFNVTPNQYLMNLRLEKAYHLMKEDYMTVTQACRSVGYESVGSFSNAFTKRFNILPSSIKS